MTPQVPTAAAAGAIALAVVVLGRRDLTRPAVAFGAVWFAFVALAQLRLTSEESPWSTGFAALVIAGGTCFAGFALLAAGTAPARRRIPVRREDYDVRRLIVAAVVLVIAAVGVREVPLRKGFEEPTLVDELGEGAAS
jgi:hypothetical protein